MLTADMLKQRPTAQALHFSIYDMHDDGGSPTESLARYLFKKNTGVSTIIKQFCVVILW